MGRWSEFASRRVHIVLSPPGRHTTETAGEAQKGLHKGRNANLVWNLIKLWKCGVASQNVKAATSRTSQHHAVVIWCCFQFRVESLLWIELRATVFASWC